MRLQRPGLPRFQPSTILPYRAQQASLLTLWHKHGTLRRAAITQGLLSIGFSAFWSTLAIMRHAAPFHLGSAASGAVGRSGAAGALAAPLAGHLADCKEPAVVTRVVTRVAARLAALAFAMLSLAAWWLMKVQLQLLAAGRCCLI